MSQKKLIVGNWKMNGLIADTLQRAQKLGQELQGVENPPFEMVLCPPFTAITPVAMVLQDTAAKYGGQDCHAESSGAYTGNVSAEMLKDIECSYVILGHSERRQHHNETSEDVAAKARAAHAAGLIAIICCGETDEERASGSADAVIEAQINASVPETATAENTVLAYEPIWAIGTGKTASADDIAKMHAHIRKIATEKITEGETVPLLYGGSVKGANAAEILHIPNVDGVLVGGASLKPDDFWQIAVASAAND